MSIRNVEIQTIGLHVGTPDHSKALPLQRRYTKSGIFTCAGTSIFGDCEDRGGVATVTIGTADSTSVQADRNLSLFVSGNSILNGDSKTKYALEIFGGSSMPLYVAGDAIFTAISPQTLSARFGVADLKPIKPFDIKHPTKGDGWRLRHVSLEGPESGVYYRGRLKESNVIHLPDYWKDLVHEDSITVHLQPIGSNQNLVIQEFNNEFIVIAEDSTNTDLITDLSIIDCFYHVYGERKDVNPLLTEYEGNDRYDYPDPNFNENSDISVEDRNYTDPNYSFPRNTITS